MAIKEVITLEGVEEVKAGIAQLNTAGEGMMRTFRDLGSSTGGTSGFDKLVDGAKKAGLELEQTTTRTTKLSEAFKVLKPVLQAAGLQIGEFGALARVASTSIVAFGAAVAGSVIVGLAKLEENAARTKGTLTDVFGSTAKGEQAFSALGQQAKQFGTTVDGLAPGLIAFETALRNVDRTAKGFVALKAEDLPGAKLSLSAAATTEAYGNFIKLLRAGRLSQDDAEKSAKAFFDTLKAGGPVTRAALEALPVGTLVELQRAFGAAGLSSKSFLEAVDAGLVTLDKFSGALAKAGPQADRAFESKAIKTFGDELGKLFATLNKGFETLSGKGFSDFITGELKRIREGIEATITDLNRLRQFDTATGSETMGKFVTSIRDAIRDATTPPKQGFDEAGFIDAGEKAGGAFNQGFLKRGFIFPPEAVAASLGNSFINAPKIEVPVTPVIKKDEFEQSLETIKTSLQTTGEQSGQNFATGLQTTIPQTLTLFQALYQSIVQLFSQPIPVNLQAQQGFFGTPFGFAGGGMIRGPGSTTSDSILAFLSNQEFVVNARAVSHYGPALFAALNAMRLPKDFIGRFAMGGLARSVSGNRFAGGGQVKSGNQVILKIDRQTFNMTAGDDTVASLKRFAVAAQLASTGRKPSWVK